MADVTTPEEARARDRFLAEHGATQVARGTYTHDVRDGTRVVGKRVVRSGQAEAEAPVVPLAELRRGRGRVAVEGPKPAPKVAPRARRRGTVERPEPQADGASAKPARKMPDPIPTPSAEPAAPPSAELAARDRRIAELEAERAGARAAAVREAVGRDRARTALWRARQRMLDLRRRVAALEAAPDPEAVSISGASDEVEKINTAAPEQERREDWARLTSRGRLARLRAWRREGLGVPAIARRTGLTRPEVGAMLFREGLA